MATFRIALVTCAVIGTAASALAVALFWVVMTHPVLVATALARGF